MMADLRLGGHAARRFLRRAALLLLACLLPTLLWAATPPGTRIVNVATLHYTLGGGSSTLASNPASVITASPATITSLKLAPSRSDATDLPIPPTAYSTNGTSGGAFAPVVPPAGLPDPSPLVQGTIYASGEPLFIEIEDLNRNLDPTAIDSLEFELSCAQSGDRERLLIRESGPDTGRFYAVIPTDGSVGVAFDGVLAVTTNCTVTIDYTDIYDNTDVVDLDVLVDPFGVVFDSVTGDPVDGAVVTMIDTATGLPATVFGDDGISPYPATVTTGGSVTDGGGTVYNFPPGNYRFPLVAPGTYRFDITPPAGYAIPSTVPDAELQLLPGAPYALAVGSRGETFVINPGPALHIDIPADPSGGEIWLSKEVDRTVVATGDFLQYRIGIENGSATTGTTAITLVDTLPLGFRYQKGSATLGGQTLADPAIAADGRGLTFTAPPLAADSRFELRYVVEVTAGAPLGEAINSVSARSTTGVRSNTAQATVEVVDDLFRSKTIIMGHVADGACGPGNPRGLPGVRLFLEDGTFVLTDEEGNYHFEGVEPGTHVVQLDTLSLPEGYTVVDCEDDTRSGGRAFSRFVELEGGTLWRVDFAAAGPDRETSQAPQQAPESADVAQGAAMGLGGVRDGEVVPDRVRGIRVRLPRDLAPRLTVDGVEVPVGRIGARLPDPERNATIHSYIGVDLGEPGTRQVVIEGIDPFGNARFRDEATITRTGPITEVRLVEVLDAVADGRTPVTVRVELRDAAGTAVPVATELAYRGGTLRPETAHDPEAGAVNAPDAPKTVAVAADGTVRFAPINVAGNHAVRLATGASEFELPVRVTPELRDWILVGFAEGTLGHNELSGSMEHLDAHDFEEDYYEEGRVRFYAKGRVRGDWLLTMAYATDKDRNDSKLFGQVDPDRYYLVYGDRSQQAYDASSAEKLYLRIERETFYAMYGDFFTGLDVTELARYSRGLSGFKSEYDDGRFAFNVFASETRQGFHKDEIRGDGTSGRYPLSQSSLVVNSEEIVLETRDRIRTDIILSTETLQRYVDYDIDYARGTLLFRRPVPSKDEKFNPIWIVVRYETDGGDDDDLTFGGRGAVRLQGDRAEVGVSVVREELGDDEGRLVGADVRVDVTPRTRVRAEVARTDTETGGTETSANAYYLSLEHRAERGDVEASFRQTETGFGLGQQNADQEGTRRYGVDARYLLRPDLTAEGLLYREERLDSGSRRDVAEGLLRREWGPFEFEAGLRGAQDRDRDGEERESLQALLGTRWTSLDQRLRLNARHEQGLGGEEDSSAFPTRTLLGGEYLVHPKATLYGEHEIAWGDKVDGNASRFGVRATPWLGGQVDAGLGRRYEEGGDRLSSLLGLTQEWQVNPFWRLSATLDRSDTLVEPVNNDLTQPFDDQDFTAVSLGAAYTGEHWSSSQRVEVRDADDGTRYGVIVGALGRTPTGLTLATNNRLFHTEQTDGDLSEADFRFGLALRPRDQRWLLLDRLDLRYDSNENGGNDLESWRIVNNLNANYRPDRKTQVAMQFGAKYVSEKIDGRSYSGFTDLLGASARYDLTPKWDVGLHGSVLHSWNSNNLEYSAGASVGYRAMTNTWVSVGYNWYGFEDDDFTLAEATAEGVFIRFRVKFDQGTAKGLFDWLGGE
jgi:uncharacterized repeat protein (TIGR01451 family)